MRQTSRNPATWDEPGRKPGWKKVTTHSPSEYYQKSSRWTPGTMSQRSAEAAGANKAATTTAPSPQGNDPGKAFANFDACIFLFRFLWKGLSIPEETRDGLGLTMLIEGPAQVPELARIMNVMSFSGTFRNKAEYPIHQPVCHTILMPL